MQKISLKKCKKFWLKKTGLKNITVKQGSGILTRPFLTFKTDANDITKNVYKNVYVPQSDPPKNRS